MNVPSVPIKKATLTITSVVALVSGVASSALELAQNT